MCKEKYSPIHKAMQVAHSSCETPVLASRIEISHEGKYDRADDRPKLAMLAIDIGPTIDRGLDDNCGPILACYIDPKIAPDDRPRITARVKPMIF